MYLYGFVIQSHICLFVVLSSWCSLVCKQVPGFYRQPLSDEIRAGLFETGTENIQAIALQMVTNVFCLCVFTGCVCNSTCTVAPIT